MRMTSPPAQVFDLNWGDLFSIGTLLPLVAGLASHGQVCHFKSQHNGSKKLLCVESGV
jgi:hypothetical protein